MSETSPSKQMAEYGKQFRRGMIAGVDVGGELMEIKMANNNYRKAHGLPMYHRNRPSMRMAEHSKLRRWETEHEGVEV